MRRPHALLALSALVPLALIAGLAVVACGGNDKPPLTPDNLEPGAENADAGAAPASSGSTPAPAK